MLDDFPRCFTEEGTCAPSHSTHIIQLWNSNWQEIFLFYVSLIGHRSSPRRMSQASTNAIAIAIAIASARLVSSRLCLPRECCVPEPTASVPTRHARDNSPSSREEHPRRGPARSPGDRSEILPRRSTSRGSRGRLRCSPRSPRAPCHQAS